MNVLFRVDSSRSIGAGHLHRCLVLARVLVDQFSANCVFVKRAHVGHMSELVRLSGFDVNLLDLDDRVEFDVSDYKTWVGGNVGEDALATLGAAKEKFKSGSIDWVVVDHYGLDKKWESVFYCEGIKIAVVDDLANREHLSSLLIDQTCGRDERDYECLVPASTRFFVGEEYCLLRPEFALKRPASLAKRACFKKVKKVMLSFGSTDPGDCTSMALKGLTPYFRKHGASAIVMISKAAPHLDKLRDLIETLPYQVELHVDANNVADLLYESDVAVGAAGSATWERCVLGVPTLLVKTAENQSEVIKRVCQFGIAKFYARELESIEVNEALESVVTEYQKISARASQLVDGYGATKISEQFKVY